MATATLSTSLSRRSMLAGGTVAFAVPAVALTPVAAPAEADARLAALEAAYWRNLRRIHALIDEAERHDCTWLEPPYAECYDHLAAREARLVAAIAETAPDGIAGLATKMRVATLSEDLVNAPQGDLLTAVFLPALSDLGRLAAGAGP